MPSNKKPKVAKNPKKEEVGYCKPPVSTRFKQGQSGNPRGRPKANILHDNEYAFQEELLKPVAIDVNGRVTTFHPMYLIARKLIEESLKGNIKAIKIVAEITKLQYFGEHEKAERRLFARRNIDRFIKMTENYRENSTATMRDQR